MADVHVSYDDLQVQAARLDDGRLDIEERLASLKAQVEELVSGGFVTEAASEAFRESFEDFTAGATRAVEGLAAMAGLLSGAAEAFAEVDRTIAAKSSSSTLR